MLMCDILKFSLGCSYDKQPNLWLICNNELNFEKIRCD